ncbi:MAG: serpin family protein [Bacilli bacterium]
METYKKDSRKKKNKITIVALLLAIIAIILLFIIYKNYEIKHDKNDTEKGYSEYRISGNELDDFDLKFLQLETNNQNMVYSPLSIKYALKMLSDGTEGTSKAQIDALIGDYKAKKYINNSNMSLANALFIKSTFKESVKESYVNSLQEKYGAEVIYDRFENPDNINSWINKKTLGLIDKSINNVSDTDFYLINALAINMEWNKLIQANYKKWDEHYSVRYAHENYSESIPLIGDYYNTLKFDNNSINAKAVEFGASINNYDIVNALGEDNIRTTISKEYKEWLDKNEYAGEKVDVKTYVNKFIEELKSNYKQVELSTDFEFYDDANIKVFAKDLKEYNGITLEYIGLMPKNKTLNEYIKTLNASSLNEIIGKIKKVELDNFEKGVITKIIGGIPLFKYDYNLKLEDDLKTLGLTDIFKPDKANLLGITKDRSTFIGNVNHKTNIEFSNEGIKASAVTRVGGLGAGSAGFEHLFDVPVVEIDLSFENPYLYIIRNKANGEIWFIGTVYQPIENNDNRAEIINKK